MAESYDQYIDELFNDVQGEERTDMLRRVFAQLSQGLSDASASLSGMTNDPSANIAETIRDFDGTDDILGSEFIPGIPVAALPDPAYSDILPLPQMAGLPVSALPGVAPPLEFSAPNIRLPRGAEVGRLETGPAVTGGDLGSQEEFAGGYNSLFDGADLTPDQLTVLANSLLERADPKTAEGAAFDEVMPFGATGPEDRTEEQRTADTRRELAGALRELKEAGVDFHTAEAKELLAQDAFSVAAKDEAAARADAKPAATAAAAATAATGPAQTTQTLAAQVASSGAITSPETREVEEVLTRRTGLDIDQQARQDRLDLSRLFELQAVRQLQKAENVRGEPRSLMDLYRGDYDKRGAADAAQRINSARAYFNRAGNIRRELMTEEETRRKSVYQRAKETRLSEKLEVSKKKLKEVRAKRKANNKYRYAKLDWDKLKWNTLSPYQTAILRLRRNEEGGRNKRANAVDARGALGSWNAALKDSANEVKQLERQLYRSRLEQSTEVLGSTRNRMQGIIDDLEETIATAKDRHATIRKAVDTFSAKTTGVSASTGGRDLSDLEDD